MTQFFSYFDRVWVGDMISCLIWPLINSWRHHNGLRTQNFNLHIMTSAYLCKIDCISVNIDRFSSKFRYVLAETILYKCSQQHFSFWQRHHGVFLRLKEACQFFTFCVLFSMGHDFFSKLDSTFPSFASNISVILASFCWNFSMTSWDNCYLKQALFCLKF